ncbi:MAG: DUF547 domain-containing protein [Halobacteriovoraceae bacterium]|nr:DUF547 domain-containing protein [Halobacteriovoraceae bacterium]
MAQEKIFDHEHLKFQELLDKSVVIKDNQSYVNYDTINIKMLEDYLNDLKTVSKQDFENWEKNKKLAYLINLYNASTIYLVTKEKPKNSIKEIGGFFSGPWKLKFIRLFNEDVNLDYIEHELIRKNFNDHRVHFVLNCASISCPSLLKKVLTFSTLNIQLDHAKKHFFSNEKKNYVDLKNKKVYVSKIFKWYREDFAKNEAELLSYFQKNLDQKILPTFEIKFLEYNWTLNKIMN